VHSSSPCRYCRRQANTWFAFTPCARATRATEAPGSKVSSTTRRFSSTECRRRCGTLLSNARSEVSTYPPSGHNRCAHLAHLRQLKHNPSRRPHRTLTYRPVSVSDSRALRSLLCSATLCMKFSLNPHTQNRPVRHPNSSRYPSCLPLVRSR
jgi:hypothetical protein